MSRKGLILVITFVFVIGAVVREFWILPRKTEFFIAQNIFVVRMPHASSLFFGSNPWFEPLIKDRFRSWFWASDFGDPSDLAVGEGIVWDNKFLLRASEGLFVLKTDIGRFLLFTSSIDLPEILKMPIDYESDFWVVWGSELISGIPIPSQGVLYLTGRKATKKWHQWASDHEIALVSTDATNHFRMIFDAETWKFFSE